MSRYLYLYRGPATPIDQFTEEQSAEQMVAWNAWTKTAGPALLDVGEPFGDKTAISDDGLSATPGDLNGYSIVEAGSLDEAKTLAAGHPFLSEGKGRFTIEIFELVAVPSS